VRRRGATSQGSTATSSPVVANTWAFRCSQRPLAACRIHSPKLVGVLLRGGVAFPVRRVAPRHPTTGVSRGTPVRSFA
jgi:hypothetical protein